MTTFVPFPPLSSSSHFLAPQLSLQQAPLSSIDEVDESEAPAQSPSTLPAPILPPEICVYKNDKDTYALTLLRQVHAENLVFPGGGARNMVVPSALMKMESSWAGLKRFSGESGGSINATLMAAGIAPKKLESLLNVTPLQELTKDVSNFESMYPTDLVSLSPEKPGPTWLNKLSHWIRTTLFKLFTGNVFNSGQRTLQLIDQWSTTSVIEECFVTADVDGSRELAPALKAKFDLLREGLNAEAREKFDQQLARLKDFAQQSEKSFQENRTGKMVTFADLAFLHQLDPAKFKELTVGGVDRETGKTVYFNATDYPDMPVAISAYISMALPMYFKGVEYAYPGKDKEKHAYIDGGMIYRVPVEPFWQGAPEGSEVRARTIVLDFLDGSQLDKFLHTSPPSEDKTLKTKLQSWLYNVPGMSVGRAEDRRNLYQAGSNVYKIDNGSLRTFPSNMSQEEQAAFKKRAADVMQEQLAWHAGEAFATPVKSPLEAFKLLSHDEREARRLAGPPTPPSEESGRPNKFAQKNFEVTQALYELCANAHEGAAGNEGIEGRSLGTAVVHFA